MMKYLNYLIYLLGIVGLGCMIIAFFEPHYFHQIKNSSNILRIWGDTDYPDPDNPEITQQGDYRGTMHIQRYNSFVFSMDEIGSDTLKFSVISGSVSYKIFYQNNEFDSIFSPPQYIFLDALTGMGPQNEFHCIKLVNNYANLQQGENCRYISTNKSILGYPEAYLELYMEVIAFGNAGAQIEIQ